MQAQLVLLRIDRDRALAQFIRRPHHTDRYLATVGDKDLVEHVFPPISAQHASYAAMQRKCAIRNGP
ncbi:hypothetical protein D3C76_1605620 [compost metagenome]